MGIAMPIVSHAALAPTRDFMRHIEEQAMEVRRQAGIRSLERFDPRVLVERAGLQLAYPQDVANLRTEVVDHFYNIDPKVWSGMGRELPDGRLLVLLHPAMTVERENVTIMEEVLHRHYEHQPSELLTHPGQFYQRIYNAQVEQEAYWTAGAALLPAKAVALAMWRGETAEDLAIAYTVSPELAEMRIKTLRLWWAYEQRPTPMRRAG